jgi:hypothetical protein
MTAVKVYKTNVDTRSKAEAILDLIREDIPGSSPSFDLDDRDKVLHVESTGNSLNGKRIVGIVTTFGYEIETLA